MQQRLPHWVVKDHRLPCHLYSSFRQLRTGGRIAFGADEPEILRPDCCLMNHFIRLDDMVVSVEHPKANLGGLPK
jgi:hypothetical protein